MIPEKYFTILGISPAASLEEVRKAYHLRVKECHPDISNAADAQKKFVEATEAYEFLMQALKDQQERPLNGGSNGVQDDSFLVWDPSLQDLVNEEMEKLRFQAKAEARKKFAEYQKTKEYRLNKSLSEAFNYLFMLLGLVVIASAVHGILSQIGSPDFSFVSMFAAVLSSALGVVMIIFPFLQRKKKKKGLVSHPDHFRRSTY